MVLSSFCIVTEPVHAEIPVPEASQLSYSQRSGAAWVTYITYYDYLKSGHDRPASELDQTVRAERGDHAVELGLALQRAILAVIGTHRRRTYAHDIVYGTYRLYTMFGKPWHAATEGNEHAHQEMKRFFHDMSCHNPKNPHSDTYNTLRLTVIKKTLLQTKAQTLLPNSKYAAMRADVLMQARSVNKGGKKRGKDSGPKGLKCYTDVETKRKRTAAQLRTEVVEGAAQQGSGAAQQGSGAAQQGSGAANL